MSHYKPYPAYKDSGVEWIGEVPEHWQVKRLEHVCTTHRRSVTPQELAPLEVFHFSIPVVQATGSGAIETGESVDSNKLLITTPQVLISKLNPRKGTVVIADADPNRLTVASTEFVPLLPKPGLAILEFIASLVSSSHLRELFESRVESVTKSHQRVLPEHITKALSAIPPLDEQVKIAAAIERETTRIDALIAKKTRFIELLQEKRQALITHAVTKGLDPTVKMKDSGVEWIGEVPEHWLVVQLGKLAKDRCDGPFGSGLKSEHYVDAGVRVVRLQNIGWGAFKDDNAAFISREHWHTVLGRGHSVVSGDLLVAGLGDEGNPLGRACVAPDDLGDALVKADCYRFRLNQQKALSPFVALSLSATARAECGFMATGATRDRLNLGLASSRIVALPPSIEEQRAIVENVQTRAARIDLLAEKNQRSIDLLKERRSAFITAAVTGQIDLREAT
jgi:type I restriction enzyme S subunit